MSAPPSSAASHVRAFDHVRALSAYAVVVHHIEQAKALLGLPGIWLAPWVQSLDTAGVDVFFGLSGYVITQSLLRARHGARGESLGRFYVRRGLRILPLYLAVVAVAFGPLPRLMAGVESRVSGVLVGALQARDLHYGALLLLHLLALPNAALVAYPGVPFATHLWSIGAEMQFYVAWPLFFSLTRRVWVAAAIATLTTLGAGLLLEAVRGGVAGLTPETLTIVRQTLGTIHARYLLAGICAAAMIRTAGPRPLEGRAASAVRVAAFATIVGLLCGRQLLPMSDVVSPVVLALALTALAVAASPADRPSPLADHLGRISYSIYAWHVLVIGVVALAVDRTIGLEPWTLAPHLALYLGVILGTAAVATVSYRVIEQPFLRIAARWR